MNDWFWLTRVVVGTHTNIHTHTPNFSPKIVNRMMYWLTRFTSGDVRLCNDTLSPRIESVYREAVITKWTDNWCVLFFCFGFSWLTMNKTEKNGKNKPETTKNNNNNNNQILPLICQWQWITQSLNIIYIQMTMNLERKNKRQSQKCSYWWQLSIDDNNRGQWSAIINVSSFSLSFYQHRYI